MTTKASRGAQAKRRTPARKQLTKAKQELKAVGRNSTSTAQKAQAKARNAAKSQGASKHDATVAGYKAYHKSKASSNAAFPAKKAAVAAAKQKVKSNRIKPRALSRKKK